MIKIKTSPTDFFLQKEGVNKIELCIEYGPSRIRIYKNEVNHMNIPYHRYVWACLPSPGFSYIWLLLTVHAKCPETIWQLKYLEKRAFS